MNAYGPWWCDTVTVLNKYTDKATHKVTWFSTVLKDCYYKHTQEKMTIGQATIASDVSTCRIPVNDAFVDKRTWNAMSEDDKAKHFTLAIGDIIVAGEVDVEINEYEKGKRATDVLAEYKEWPGYFTVDSVNINVGGGRGNEHYHAKGV